VERPGLRIVQEALWQAAHQRVAQTRARYIREVRADPIGVVRRGLFTGRPDGSVESRYLLTGFLQCWQCRRAINVSVQTAPAPGWKPSTLPCSISDHVQSAPPPLGARLSVAHSV
jgi:hypothetical protein